MDPDLSRRVGLALNHVCDFDERDTIIDETSAVQTFDDLPVDVQELIEELETRPWKEGVPTAPWEYPNREAATAGLIASAHAGCEDSYCRNPLHPGPCKKWRFPTRRDRRRDTGDPAPEGGDGGRRPSLGDRLRPRSQDKARVPGQNPRHFQGRFTWRDSPWFDAIPQDTGDEGIPIRHIELPYGIGAGQGSYVVDEGTVWKIDGVAYLVEHPDTKRNKERALEMVRRTHAFHMREIAPGGGDQYQRGYAFLQEVSPYESEGHANGTLPLGEGIVATAGDGNSTWWAIGNRRVPAGDDFERVLRHEYGHNVARYGRENEDRLDHAQEWSTAGQRDSADGGPASRVVGLRVDASMLDGKINGGGDLPGRPYPRGVTAYGATSPGEDFAESVMMYRSGQIGVGRHVDEPQLEVPIYFRDLFPARAAELDALFPEMGEQQRAEVTRVREQARREWEQRA